MRLRTRPPLLTYLLSFSVFSGTQLGCAPARRSSLRMNPGI